LPAHLTFCCLRYAAARFTRALFALIAVNCRVLRACAGAARPSSSCHSPGSHLRVPTLSVTRVAVARCALRAFRRRGSLIPFLSRANADLGCPACWCSQVASTTYRASAVKELSYFAQSPWAALSQVCCLLALRCDRLAPLRRSMCSAMPELASAQLC
jgi:hypothetical protein